MMQIPISGDSHAHDPSTLIREGNAYYYFATGIGIISRSSNDLRAWQSHPPVFERAPDWTTSLVPGFKGHFWAPDIARFGERYNLYFSVSTFGKQVSAIGLVTSPTLNPSHPDFGWTDHGPIIASREGDPYNTIDPAIFVDDDESVWIVFGSFWQGIFMFELDPHTGLRRHPDAAPIHLAKYEAIEAPYICKRGSFYYLFVNFDFCCRGVNSTYNIRVGRSESLAGPYLDRSGKPMLEGGGTLLVATDGDRIGPGHAGILIDNGREYFSHHFYDAQSQGKPTFALREIHWVDGWPAIQ